ncbi:MAG: MFS transporter, partial [Ectothiorhodospiraceae bacterium]|nr:MFS transporter [Ectothiorhodospiraceae bacterium]
LMVMASIVWTVTARHPFTFFLAFGVLMSLGFSFTSPVALTPVLSRWFTRRRGMALFFLSTGSMAGIAIMTPVLAYAIETSSWQNTMIGFGVIFLVLVIPTTLFVIRDDAPADTDLIIDPATNKPEVKTVDPRTASLELSWREAIRTRPFWQVALGLFACGFSMNLLGTHGVPMLVAHGFDPITASYGIGLIGLVAIPSTILLGRLADKVAKKNLLSVIYLVRGLGFFALLMVAAVWELYLVAAIGGVVWAGSIALSSAILADIYGVRVVGILYGWTYLAHQIGAMISSWLGGWGYDAFGTHWVAFGASGAVLLIASVISFRLPVRDYLRRATTPEPAVRPST